MSPVAETDHRNIVQRVLDWLRAGYPQGVPQSDYVALMGILHRTLTEDEVLDVARALTRSEDDQAPITREAIAAQIERTTVQHASEQDIARVSGKLAAGGWPLAGLGQDQRATSGGTSSAPAAGDVSPSERG